MEKGEGSLLHLRHFLFKLTFTYFQYYLYEVLRFKTMSVNRLFSVEIAVCLHLNLLYRNLEHLNANISTLYACCATIMNAVKEIRASL